MSKVLIKFRHGLGDCVQLTVVLRHLRVAHPDWEIDIVSSYGKHTVFNGLCRQSFICSPAQKYDLTFDLKWDECTETYSNHPSTKAEKCLKEVFKLDVNPELCSYKMIFRGVARKYL